jgi:tetratricopeptide (TPR) repeat protein
LNTSYPEAYFERGMCYYQKEEDARAISDFTRSLELKSDNAEAYYFRGLSYSYLARKNEACSDLQRASKMNYAEANLKLKELGCH